MMKNTSINRFSFIGGALSIFGILIIAWMVKIQTSPKAKTIEENAQSSIYVTKVVYPERGNIYDRWGHLLAGNVEVYEVGVNMNSDTDLNNIAMTVSTVVGVDYQDILTRLSYAKVKGLSYIALENSVPLEKVNTLKTMRDQLKAQAASVSAKKQKNLPSLDGLTWRPYLERSYPEHTVGSTVVGFTYFKDREEGRGYLGVEGEYDHLLAGQPVKIKVPNDPYRIDKLPNIPPGASLMLTIDREVQRMTEQVLDKAVADNGAKSGSIVVMNPNNGEILAMASTPRFDPNEYWKYSEVFQNTDRFNRAIESPYEPGSVFKVLTMAAALDSGTVTPETSFLDTGTIVVGGQYIHNWNGGAWGPQDMTGCMMHSLNVCLAWIGTETGPTKFYNYMQHFGIGHVTGIDLAGEANWPLSLPGGAYWSEATLGSNSFGQALETTPIQMITAISAVANNQGKMMTPHILKAVMQDGEEYQNPATVAGTPITANTAKTLTDMLAVSVEQETTTATVPGYRVAGKTGTGQIAGPGGYDNPLTNASFVGWGPVDDPQFIVYVWLEEPTASIWGSVVAAPVFSDVVKNLVVLMDIPPDSARQELMSGKEAASPAPVDDSTEGQ